MGERDPGPDRVPGKWRYSLDSGPFVLLFVYHPYRISTYLQYHVPNFEPQYEYIMNGNSHNLYYEPASGRQRSHVACPATVLKGLDQSGRSPR